MPTSGLKAVSRYEDWLHLRLALVSCYQGSPRVLEMRWVPTGLTAWLICRGHGEIVAAGQLVRATAGQWLIPRPVPRLQRFSMDVELLSLNFYAQWPTGEPLYGEGLDLVLPAEDYPELERTAQTVNRKLEEFVPRHDYSVFTQAMPLDNYLAVQGLFADFFAAFARALASRGILPTARGTADPRLTKALAKVQNASMDEPLAIEQVAAEVGISCVHLNRLALKHLGHTLHQQHERRRSEYARRCLLTPGTQVKQVALSLGFTTLGHFSRWFSRIHGMSPTVFRREYLPGGRA